MEQKARVHFIDGTTAMVPVKDVRWVGEEGARSATALVDGREVPIYNRQEWGFLWEEQVILHNGECIECGRLSSSLNEAGVCQGCVMQAMIDE